MFIVHPKLNYDARKDYDETRKIYKQQKLRDRPGARNSQRDENEKKLKELEKKVEEEEEINKKQIQVKSGEFVAYGNEI